MAATTLQLFGNASRDEERRDGGTTFIEDELERETLSTEKLRVSVLLIVAGLGVAFSIVPVRYLSANVEHAFRGNAATFVQWRFVVLFAWALYLLGERVLLGYLNRRGRRLPRFYRYFTAFVETSCPTAEILVAASYTNAEC